MNRFWCRIVIETLGDISLWAGPSAACLAECSVRLVWTLWTPAVRVCGGRKWGSPVLTGNAFLSILPGTSRSIGLPWEPRTSCMYIQCTSSLLWHIWPEWWRHQVIFLFWLLFPFLIVGYSWPRWSTRSSRYSRMQRDKGKSRTETLFPFEHVYLTLHIEELGNSFSLNIVLVATIGSELS